MTSATETAYGSDGRRVPHAQQTQSWQPAAEPHWPTDIMAPESPDEMIAALLAVKAAAHGTIIRCAGYQPRGLFAYQPTNIWGFLPEPPTDEPVTCSGIGPTAWQDERIPAPEDCAVAMCAAWPAMCRYWHGIGQPLAGNIVPFARWCRPEWHAARVHAREVATKFDLFRRIAEQVVDVSWEQILQTAQELTAAHGRLDWSATNPNTPGR